MATGIKAVPFDRLFYCDNKQLGMLRTLHRLIFEVSCIRFCHNRHNEQDLREYQEQEFYGAKNGDL